MNVKNLFAAVAVFAAAGSAFAQQTEFVAPDAGFTVQRDPRRSAPGPGQAASEGARPSSASMTARTRGLPAGNRSRQDVRAEAIRSASSRRAGDVNDLYFGA